MAAGGKSAGGVSRRTGENTGEESSESDGETEPALSFHRRLSTNKDIKRAASTKEGYLMKQTWSFQRWRRRYFKLRGNKLYYAKDTKAVIFDEISLTDLSFAECSIKNVNHSFQLITPYRRLVLCAESRREMEEWISALKAASSREYYEAGEHPDFLSGHHHWYATSHARPTYCNVCREALSGVTSHGLSCEVCKCKVHKRCAVKAISNCKWTTLASIGKDIIEDDDGTLTMPHQWMEGNLPVSAKCAVCDKTCGSVLRLQDWRCLWCRATVHTACRPLHPVHCPLGPSRVSVVPPTALHSIGSDEAWEATRPQGSSPLLVFVNSKSGDNQGVKFLRRFKQLLNPAQVFDLISTGPGLGLRLFRHFNPFRILVCSGDGSIGWVLSEIDRLSMHKQCQLGVLPLGTGNDLARVLGWGSSCDDDTHLPQLLERYEMASTKMLDRWSIMTYERSITISTRKLSHLEPSSTIAAYEDSLVSHLTKILQSDQHTVVISSAKVLCETVKDFIVRAAEVSIGQGDQQFSDKCQVLKDKLDLLLQTLHQEEVFIQQPEEVVPLPDGEEKSSLERPEKDVHERPRPPRRMSRVAQRETLMSRANSLKKAIRQLVEHTEQAVDEQNKPPLVGEELPVSGLPQFTITPPPPSTRSCDTLQVLPTIESVSSTEVSPCPSPHSFVHSSSSTELGICSRLTAISPLPDLRRDSACDDLLPLPVPLEFADPRRSLVPSEDGEGSSLAVPAPKGLLPPSQDSVPRRFSASLHDEVCVEKVEIKRSASLEDFALFSEPKVLSKEEKDIGNTIVASSKGDLMCDESQSALLSTSESLELKRDFNEGIGFLENLEGPNSLQDNHESDTLRVDIESLTSSPIEDDDKKYMFDSLFVPDRDGDASRRGSSVLEDIEKVVGHIDSPDNTETDNIKDDTSEGSEEALKHEELEDVPLPPEVSLQSELVAAGFPVTPSPNIDLMSPEEELEEDDDSGELVKVRGASLAHFSEGNDIGRKSFYKHVKTKAPTDKPRACRTLGEREGRGFLDIVKIQIQGSSNNLSGDVSRRPSGAMSDGEEDELLRFHVRDKPRPRGGLVKSESEEGPTIRHHDFPPIISVVVNPPSPVMSDEGGDDDGLKLRRFSEDSAGKLLASSTMEELRCSPAASRRISSISLLKAPGSERDRSRSIDKEPVAAVSKKLPIINPLVRLPMWPNISGGAGLVSKALLANADALCAAASPLMDPDETLMEGYYERVVMNNYFGIGIDAKISLDFHQKREEHPEKCRSRAKNYMWYGVLGSKEWLQKTYKNLEQRVKLECDGQRIPLPSLQGIVILNIPSFMGGTNFWGGTKEDDCFLAPSFDDRVLEVVAVFGSVQMAASRLINLQHHRIAQCQTIQITILDEGVPVQVDGEAWVQPPGMIRIIHKNRMQMLCRNRALETSLKQWEEKQRHAMSHSQSSQSSQSQSQPQGAERPRKLSAPFTDDENQLLVAFIECVTTLVKYVKLLTISHPSIEDELYQLAVQTSAHLEKVHPGGKIVEGPNLRPQVTELVSSARQLYEEACNLLREKAHHLKLREDLEGKLSAALGSMEMELRKCVTYDSAGLVHFQQPEDQGCGERKGRSRGLFWQRFRRGGSGSGRAARDVAAWGTAEVAAWLDTLQLPEYAESFVRHDIRGRELLTLGRRDLKELGVTKVGHVKRILQAVRDLTM
ncbi:diacylglycerol kinase eta isoform X2 [Bacillus rossius redtenbacheri]|uniref:diacylglycerol kinase eta isoform X2 n=1 Tax=Bacillus rossius redtenbacheri TaxID=93214 RepID=UPI002FDE1822